MSKCIADNCPAQALLHEKLCHLHLTNDGPWKNPTSTPIEQPDTEELKKDKNVRKFMSKYRYQYSRTMLDDLVSLIESHANSARIDELKQLLDAQDQETDLDGRATSPVYHIISGDGERFLIENRIEELEKKTP